MIHLVTASPLGKKIFIGGNGAEKTIPFLANAKVTHASHAEPTATFMHQAALLRFNNNDFCDLDSFEPNYLKPPYTKQHQR